MLKKIPPFIVLAIVVFVATLVLTACGRADDEVGHYTIGLATNNPNGLKNVEGFRDEMTALGYIEGENVTYFFADEPTKGDDLDAALESMVEAEVDLIFTAGTPTGVAAHRITKGTNIPVVFGVIANPIDAGVMDDLTMPGGNMTGVQLSQNQARRLELLLEIAPDIQRVFFPYNPDDAAPISAMAQIFELAPGLGIEVVEGFAQNDDEVTTLLNNLPEDIDAIFMLPDSTINARVDDLVAIAIERKLPVSGPSMVQVEEGVLMAYGTIHYEVGTQAASIANQILKGADPGELPVQTAEYYLGINIQTAEAIGVEIPASLVQAAEVIITIEK
ncbi:MAG: ABC transporter substrate-binding protein [Chloroflexi bacterium]|jgi:putative tryptophan/tyrosine transport system substrate-binding protein|nr:ABC transporter substrate-binding protein [Chloroflexota bacterium]